MLHSSASDQRFSMENVCQAIRKGRTAPICILRGHLHSPTANAAPIKNVSSRICGQQWTIPIVGAGSGDGKCATQRARPITATATAAAMKQSRRRLLLSNRKSIGQTR